MRANFSEVFEDVTKLGCKIPKEHYLDKGDYPIIDQGQKYIAGYSNNSEGLYSDVPAIIFGDHTRIIKYVDMPCFLGADGVKLLHVKDKDNDVKYLYYALCNARIPDTGYNRHFKWLKELEIPLPPLPEQRHIAAVLDKVSELIALRKRQLDLLDEMVKARFVEMFGDCKTNSKGLETAKGYELFKFSSGKFLTEDKRLSTGIPVYGGNGIAWYTNEYLIDYPTIVIGRVGAQCGNIHFTKTPIWITDNAIFIKEKKTQLFTLEFLSEMMNIMNFNQYADYSGQPKITQKPLENIEYLIPEKEEQKIFSDFYHQVDKSKATVQQGLDRLNLLKSALMQEYFG